MKKLLMLLATLLLAIAPVLAEEAPAVPVEILPQTGELLSMDEAVNAARATLPALPADCLTRAELVRLSDGSCQWIVTVFDLSNFADGWCITVDGAKGAVLTMDTTDVGYFHSVSERWQAALGVKALWSLENKLLFDNLYTMQPTYGLPLDGDMSSGEALTRAMAAVGLTRASDYEIGYGYLMGAGENNGVWEVYFVQAGEVVCKVNLDAVSGEIYLIEPDEEGNG